MVLSNIGVVIADWSEFIGRKASTVVNFPKLQSVSLCSGKTITPGLTESPLIREMTERQGGYHNKKKHRVNAVNYSKR